MLARFRVPLGWGELLKRTGREAYADDVLSLAAQQAYYFFFALFPALLALLSSACFLPIAKVTDDVVTWGGRGGAGGVVSMVNDGIR